MADVASQIAAIREKLPLLLRTGGQGGLSTADELRQHEFSVLDVLDILATLSRGNRIWAFELGGLAPSSNGEWQEGDLYLDAGGQVPGGNLWQYIDGEWVLLLDLRGRDGSQLLGGAGAPAAPLGNLGDWYFQYGTAAWQKTGNGWVNRFALGTGTALPAQAGQDGKVLGTDGTTAGWVNPASGLPSQAGQAGKILKTDGTAASWADSAVGVLTNLLTTVKSSSVAAINELFGLMTNNRSDIGTLSSLNTTSKGNLVGAINEVLAPQPFSPLVLVAGGVTVLNCANAATVRRTLMLTANTTVRFDNMANGTEVLLRLVQDATGGRTVTWAVGAGTLALPPDALVGAAANARTTVAVLSDGSRHELLLNKYFG